jgi:hypothetical protein
MSTLTTEIHVRIRKKKRSHILYGVGSKYAFCVEMPGRRQKCGLPVLLDAAKTYDVTLFDDPGSSTLDFSESGISLESEGERARFVPETTRCDRVQRVEARDASLAMGFDFVFLQAKEIEAYETHKVFNVIVRGESTGPFDTVDGEYQQKAVETAFSKALADAVTLSNSLHAHIIELNSTVRGLEYDDGVARVTLNIVMRQGAADCDDDDEEEKTTTTTSPHMGMSMQRLRNLDASLPASSRLTSVAEREEAFRRGRLPHYDPIAIDTIDPDDFVAIHNRVWRRSSLIEWIMRLRAFRQRLQWPTDMQDITPEELQQLDIPLPSNDWIDAI